ncbi:hypothetical protein Moror_5174 [Moniliophthora roreri MCA 2997]|uniref:Uncharacterized protein n=2 Tax=Moniliophthora roreri TaxID=221103 RepID=V2X8W1_MONRO|nr:hypothetical protein Moror_5174 [Moniliophthora roreri MCA 2997]
MTLRGMTGDQWDLHGKEYRRPLGNSEIAYYYPSLQNGLNDMFLHIAFRANKMIMDPERVVRAWAVIRSRHPLLMSKVIDNDSSPHFSFTPNADVNTALAESRGALYFKTEGKDELIFNYMNGPRTLSSIQLSYLVVSSLEEQATGTSTQGEYDLLMCAPHFLGDGASLHQCTHELLSVLSSPNSISELEQELLGTRNWAEILPIAVDDRLPPPGNRLKKAASNVNLIKTLEREIGGHTLPRKQRGSSRTVLKEAVFTEAQTSIILAKCKSHNVTVNHAVFVLCNIAWGRCNTKHQRIEHPLMMYTAINLRPFLLPHPTSTYWFLALTYYNVVLPAFLPTKPSAFWLRAQSVKSQTRKVVQSSFLPYRAMEMAKIRSSRAQGKPMSYPRFLEERSSLEPPPSACLLGLSLIGNLDVTYTRSAYPSIELHNVTTASRQKAGGILLLEHSFARKLWLHLFWDEMGFEEGQIEAFWQNLQDAVVEFLT